MEQHWIKKTPYYDQDGDLCYTPSKLAFVIDRILLVIAAPFFFVGGLIMLLSPYDEMD